MIRMDFSGPKKSQKIETAGTPINDLDFWLKVVMLLEMVCGMNTNTLIFHEDVAQTEDDHLGARGHGLSKYSSPYCHAGG